MAKIENFDKALSLFVRAATRSLDLARTCSQMALQEFNDSGNITQAQQFLDAIPQNFIRKAAFIKWMMAYAPVSYEKGKLSKDKSEDANAFDLVSALKVDFWNFAPDKEVIHVNGGGVVTQLERVVKRLESDSYELDGDVAKEMVKKTKNFVEMLRKSA